MSIGSLVAIGLVLELLIGVYIFVLQHLEKTMLDDFVNAAQTDLMGAVEELPMPYQSVARPFSDQLAMEQDLDDALVDAVVDTTRQPFKKPLALRLVVGVVCSIAFLAPVSYGLMQVAGRIVAAWQRALQMEPAEVYSFGQTELEGPFMLLRTAFQGSAMLFFGLAFLWAFAWYTRRPEVREARFIRALLEVATRASPGTPAPVSGRLAELIAPDRGLERPAVALFVCVLGITGGYGVLYQTADVRAANNREPVYRVWPAKSAPVLTDLTLPKARAGAPIFRLAPTLHVSPEVVKLQGDLPFLQIVDGAIPDGWQAEVPAEVTRRLSNAKGRVMVLAAPQLPMSVILELMQYLERDHDVGQFDLIVSRTLLTGGPGGRAIQAFLPLEVRPSERPVALAIEMGDGTVRVLPDGVTYSQTDNSWRGAVRRAVVDTPSLWKRESAGVVEIQVASGEPAYGRFIEILSAADTSCKRASDCGLPGHGLQFRLRVN